MAEQSPESLPPLIVRYSDVADAEVEEAYQFMLRFGFAEGERFLSALQSAAEAEVEVLRQDILQRSPLTRTPSGRTRYSFRFRTGGRRSSTWFAKYELRDVDDDNQIDSLLIVAVFHGSSARAQEEL